jgi:uncharacterized lipoprotein YehR (DUF1307 family)
MENVEYSDYLSNMITNDARLTRKSKSGIVMEKVTRKRKKSFYQQIGLKFKEETTKVLHLEHIFVWC